MRATKATLRMETPERLATVVDTLSAAVPISSIRRASARPSAKASPATTGSSISVSGWPER